MVEVKLASFKRPHSVTKCSVFGTLTSRVCILIGEGGGHCNPWWQSNCAQSQRPYTLVLSYFTQPSLVVYARMMVNMIFLFLMNLRSMVSLRTDALRLDSSGIGIRICVHAKNFNIEFFTNLRSKDKSMF